MVLLLICYKSTFEFKLKPQFVVLFFLSSKKKRRRKGDGEKVIGTSLKSKWTCILFTEYIYNYFYLCQIGVKHVP